MVGLILAIALDTVLQIAWKLAVAGIPESASVSATVHAAVRNPYFYIALVVFPVQLWNWTRVLARTDLSFAQPITSLGIITILTFSSFVFHEKITWLDFLGVSMIFLGIFLISQTPYKTVPSASQP